MALANDKNEMKVIKTEDTTTATMKKLAVTAKSIYMNTCPADDMDEFVKICKMGQRDLKSSLANWIAKSKRNYHIGDGYILVEGDENTPVLLTAHMDTVHKERIKDFYIYETEKENYITSPEGIGGDDRCGIYMIKEVVNHGYNPWILFCEDEEVGGVGSNKFVKSEDVDLIKDLKFFIELDRANSSDAVYYNCGNKDFQSWIEDFGFKTAYGSFSDISHLSPATDTASVNLSCGYYNAHTLNEYVVWEEMLETIAKVELILDAVMKRPDMDKYEYEEEKWGSYGGSYGGYGNYGVFGRHLYDFYDEYEDGYGYQKSNSNSKKKARKGYSLKEDIPSSYVGYFIYTDDEGYEEFEEQVYGDSKLSCIAKFLMENDVKWSQVLDYYFDIDD